MARSPIRQNNSSPSPPSPNGRHCTTAGMPHSKSHIPIMLQRARKSVRTPVLEMPSASSKRVCESSLDDSNPQLDHENQSQIPSNVTSNPSTAQTAENDMQWSRSNASSGLTSPMMSPGLRALETSFDREARNTSSTTAYDCFNSQPHLKGHFYSANHIFARGVWIGYLAPDRQSQSFRGLPSFHDLKVNYSKFSPPHPPTVQGSPREDRNAVCRGCAREESALIALSEMQFGKKVKVVIMPLDGDDDAGVFAIMIPQKSDRSLHGLQSFRPYETTSNGMGETFVNNYMMLTLRNPDSDAGTLETVLTVLPPQERVDIVLRLKRLPEPSKHSPSTPKPSRITNENFTTLATHVTAKVDDDVANAQLDQPATRKRRKVSDNAANKYEVTDISSKDDSAYLAQPPQPPSQPSQTPQITSAPADDVKHHTPIIPEPSTPPPRAAKATDPSKIIPLDLIDGQAERVWFIWSVIDDDTDYEFVHTLGECKSFGGLLGLLKEDADAIPCAASIIGRTNVWRLTYRLGNGANKAVVLRKGNEAAFDRLQSTLAEASIWQDNPNAQVNIDLKSLRKPGPV